MDSFKIIGGLLLISTVITWLCYIVAICKPKKVMQNIDVRC